MKGARTLLQAPFVLQLVIKEKIILMKFSAFLKDKAFYDIIKNM